MLLYSCAAAATSHMTRIRGGDDALFSLFAVGLWSYSGHEQAGEDGFLARTVAIVDGNNLPMEIFPRVRRFGSGEEEPAEGTRISFFRRSRRRGAAAHRRRAIGARSFPGLAFWLLATLWSQILVKIQSTGPEFHSFAYRAGLCFRCKVEGDHHSRSSQHGQSESPTMIVAVRCAGLCAQEGGGGGGGQGSGR
jgi:hypothetical protein